MKTAILGLLLLGFVMPLLADLPEMTDFARYRVILDRKPFGEVIAPAAPAQPPGPPPDSFIKHLRMVAITEDDMGTRVGFVDLRSNPPKPYFLYVGQSADGIAVIDADFEGESAVLESGGDQQAISMRGDSGAAPPTTAVQTGSGTPDNRPSYVARRRRRRTETEAPPAPAATLTPDQLREAAEIEKHLQEQQMNAIRSGLPPLPIPLTPEMDDQLVAEGVLPPLEE